MKKYILCTIALLCMPVFYNSVSANDECFSLCYNRNEKGVISERGDEVCCAVVPGGGGGWGHPSECEDMGDWGIICLEDYRIYNDSDGCWGIRLDLPRVKRCSGSTYGNWTYVQYTLSDCWYNLATGENECLYDTEEHTFFYRDYCTDC